jgi:hypothetical protein
VSEPRSGRVAPEIAAEFPGLRLELIELELAGGPSPPALRRRLAEWSDRSRGAALIAQRTRPVERAYRTFYRQSGLDPDLRRPPGEAAAVSRLLRGGFGSVDRLTDARLIALLETGVPVWALDAAGVGGGALEIRTGSSAGGAPGALIVAAGERAAAILFDDPVPELSAGARTRRAILYAIGVDGVPAIHVEEALWICRNLVGVGDAA